MQHVATALQRAVARLFNCMALYIIIMYFMMCLCVCVCIALCVMYCTIIGCHDDRDVKMAADDSRDQQPGFLPWEDDLEMISKYLDKKASAYYHEKTTEFSSLAIIHAVLVLFGSKEAGCFLREVPVSTLYRTSKTCP